jgi:hypothetical protein
LKTTENSNLESHEFVVRLGSPGVDLYRFFQCYHKEFDALVFDNFEVHGTLQVANVDPAVTSLHLLLTNSKDQGHVDWKLDHAYLTSTISSENL